MKGLKCVVMYQHQLVHQAAEQKFYNEISDRKLPLSCSCRTIENASHRTSPFFTIFLRSLFSPLGGLLLVFSLFATITGTMNREEVIIALKSAAEAGEAEVVAELCEVYELNVATGSSSDSPFYVTHLLALLSLGEKENARFLWRRLPPRARTAKAAAIWKVGKALWQDDMKEAFQALSALQLEDVDSVLAKHVHDALSARMFSLIAKSYSSISTESLAENVGLSEEEAVARAKQLGWSVEEGGKALAPSDKGMAGPTAEVSPDVLKLLTKYVAYLESAV